MTNFMQEQEKSANSIPELTAQVMAAEVQLSYFAARHGKESQMYRDSLQDFAAAWHQLKKNRDTREFMKDVKAS